jgi:AcrR family transcriptional regulator
MTSSRPRRTQADRSAATRAALIAAGRALFTEHGYAEVGTDSLAAAAGVTRGALYHQFADKAELFAAVFEAVEVDVSERLATQLTAASDDPIEVMVAGADAWLDACAEPEVQRIVLLDGPAVLGWEQWREIGLRHGMGLVRTLLELAIAVGRIPTQPVEPLAHLLVGALDEAALYVARAEDPPRAREEMHAVVRRFIAGFTSPDAI